MTNCVFCSIMISTGEGNTPRANAGAQVEIGEAKKFPTPRKLKGGASITSMTTEKVCSTFERNWLG